MKAKTNTGGVFLAAVLFIVIGVVIPFQVEAYAGCALNGVRFLGLMTAGTGFFLYQTLRSVKPMAFLVTALLSFQFSNSLIRQFTNAGGANMRFASYVRKDVILLLGCMVFGIVIPVLFYKLKDIIFTEHFAMIVPSAIIVMLYIPLVIKRIASGADATAVTVLGITPLEIIKVLLCVQFAVIASYSKKQSSMFCTLFYVMNSLVMVLLLRETGAFLIFSAVYFVLMLYHGFVMLGVVCTAGLSGAVLGGSYIGSFMTKLAATNPTLHDKAPFLYRKIEVFYSFFMRRIDGTNAVINDGSHIGYARAALARTRLFSGYGSLGYLTQGDTDMAYVGCVENFGLLAGLIILVLLTALPVMLFLYTRRIRDLPAVSSVQLAISVMFSVETILMTGGALGILPLTGLPTFFLSRATTANLAAFLALYLFDGCTSYGRVLNDNE